MPIGTTAAIALGLGGLGASAAGGAMQANAAKNAAKQQSASADRAMQLQSQMFERALQAQAQQNAATQQLYAPYTRTAPMSLAALNNFVLGGGQGYMPPSMIPGPRPGGPSPNMMPPPMQPPGGPVPGMIGGPQQPNTMSLGQVARRPMTPGY